jgi:hypothetical protein
MKEIVIVKVTPVHNKHGYTAPYLLEEIDIKEKNIQSKAKELAKKRTALSQFSVWNFICTIISYKVK